MFSLVVLFWAPVIGFFFSAISHPVGSFDSSSSKQNALTCLDIWRRQSEFNAVQGPVAPGLHPLSLLKTFLVCRVEIIMTRILKRKLFIYLITVVSKLSVVVVVCSLELRDFSTTNTSSNHMGTLPALPEPTDISVPRSSRGLHCRMLEPILYFRPCNFSTKRHKPLF